jgi:hypothetical protein
MAQVNSSPGVPKNLVTVVASSATPILSGPRQILGTGIIGTGVIYVDGHYKWVSSTGTANINAAQLIEAGVVVTPFTSHTPIVLPTQLGLFP